MRRYSVVESKSLDLMVMPLWKIYATREVVKVDRAGDAVDAAAMRIAHLRAS